MPDLFLKLEGSELDYTASWADWLADGETIATSSWVVSSGITKEGDSKTDDTTTIIVSGGNGGNCYTALNTILTTGGYTEQRLFGFLVPTEANLLLLAKLRNYQGIERDAKNSLLSRAVDASIKWIEAQIHRSIEPVAATKYYEQESIYPAPYTLELDSDLLSVTTLTNGAGTVIPASEYTLLPRNSERFDRIKLKAGSSYAWEWPLDGEASVLGSWGYWSSLPANMEQAILRLGAFLYRQADAQIFDTVANPVAGTIIVPQGIARDVLLLIGSYKRGGIA